MRRRREPRVTWRLIGRLISTALAATIAALAVWFGLTYRIGVVPSDSMSPTLKFGDQYLINVRAYRHKPPQRREVIVFRQDNGDFLVKRVVGIAGDWVVVTQGHTYLNGTELQERYAVWSGEAWNDRPQQAVVKEGEVFVLGDNRDRSEDSRDFGAVPTDTVLGRAERIIFPRERRAQL